MPEVAGLLNGQTGAHFAIPALVVESVQYSCTLDFQQKVDVQTTNDISARLFDVAACLDWIDRERQQPCPTEQHARHIQGRLLGVMVSHCLTAIRTLEEAAIKRSKRTEAAGGQRTPSERASLCLFPTHP